jgi:hypothetical protein
MKTLLMILMLIGLFPAWGGEGAGFGKGNGGYGVYCPKDQSWMMLDYFEAQALHELTVDEKLLNNENLLSIFADRLMKIDSTDSYKFREFALKWSQEVVFVDARDLGPINDVFPSVLPEGCELKLAGFQRAGRYFLSKVIWKEMTTPQQKVLMLHELVYRAMLDRREMHDSRPVRAIVALLISENFETMSAEEFIRYYKLNISNY